MARHRITELADEIGISERDVIDVAHDAGIEQFSVDGYDVDYADFDQPTPMITQRGYSARHGIVIDLEDVEVDIDDLHVDRFNYLTGAEL